MRRTLIALLALIAFAAPAVAQQVFPQIPTRAVALGVTSGNVAAATATATLPAPTDGTLVYLCGFSTQSNGATAAGSATITVTGFGSTFTMTQSVATGAGVPNAPVGVSFDPCVPASGPNTAIVVQMGSLGAGNTQAAVNAWGYRY